MRCIMPNHIVVISQDKETWEKISNILEKQGYRTSFYQPESFQNAYQGLNARLIFLDLVLSGTDGIEVLHFLSKMKYQNPVILMGATEERVLASAKRIGRDLSLQVTACLTLPLDEAVLLKALDTIHDAHFNANSEQLVKAIENNEFVLYYQPKMELKTHRIIGVEALIRWTPSYSTVVEPSSFIPMTEQSGLIIPLTYWIVREAISQIACWKKDNKIDMKVAINLSAKSLADSILPDEVNKIVEECGVDPGNICFEITESAAMENPSLINEILTRLRIKGYYLSIDDFGTGYSSLIELQRLPFSEIKIDQSFIKKVTFGHSEAIITRSIIDLSRNLDLVSVAEGVDNAEALAWLEDQGCDIVQGFYIAKPMPADKFLVWLKNNTDESLRYKG